MQRIISSILLAAGLLTIIGGVLWGWKEGVFDWSRMGAGIGLTRTFFLFLYMPIAIGITIAGCILLFKGWIARNNLIKMGGFLISFFLFMIALGFVVSNVTSNIRNYGGDDLWWVLTLNFVFTSPMLFLSGLFFLISQLKN